MPIIDISQNYKIKDNDYICRAVVSPFHINKNNEPKIALFAHKQLMQNDNINKLSVFVLSIANEKQIKECIINPIEADKKSIVGFLTAVCEKIKQITINDIKTIECEVSNIDKFNFTDEQLQTYCFNVIYCPITDFIFHAVIGYSDEAKEIINDCISNNMEDIHVLIRERLLSLFKKSTVKQLSELNFITNADTI